jgi:uncharacterized protein involved in exopolysaccharide biosynthesis
MNNLQNIFTLGSSYRIPLRSTVIQKPWERYLLWGVVANTLIWGAALSYLKFAPITYASSFSLDLPGAGPAVDVNLPNIGQASSTGAASGMASLTSDPRANYSYLLTSDSVIESAAVSLGISTEEFGEPRVKLVDNTTIMQMEITASSPQEAQEKAHALYRAFTSDLNRLRESTARNRDRGSEVTMNSARQKLEAAQSKLSRFKTLSGISSPEQIRDLSTNVEQLRKQQVEAIALQQQATSRLQQLSTNLGLSPQEAAKAFTLQNDQIFQQDLKEYSQITNNLTVLNATLSPQHPLIIEQRGKQREVRNALSVRSSRLVGQPVSQQMLSRVNLAANTPNSARESLFQNLVTLQSEQQGATAQAQALTQQLSAMEARLRTLTQQEATLSNLQRSVQIAETVYASTLAKLDLGKSNVFADYPQVQMLERPSLPKQPTSPKSTFVLGGAFLSSLFSMVGLTLLWRRDT